MLEGPKSDEFADGKAYKDNSGAVAAPKLLLRSNLTAGANVNAKLVFMTSSLRWHQIIPYLRTSTIDDTSHLELMLAFPLSQGRNLAPTERCRLLRTSL